MEKTISTKTMNQAFSGLKKERTIVLIHGLWMTPLSWKNWADRFTAHGYNVITSGWPGVGDRSVEDIRKNPEALRGIGLGEITSHYEKIIRGLDAPPIIMGHSIGGLITQMLLNKGLGCSGVGISAGQTKGVLKLPLATIRTAWPALRNPFNTNGLAELSFKQFRFSFTNGLSEETSRMVYDKFYIPGPTRPLIQAGLANFTPNALSKVDYQNPNRGPLLFVAAERDQTVPASVNKENAYRYHTPSVTDFRMFSDRNHFIVGQDGWEEVADYCLNWAIREATEFESVTLH